MSSRLLSKIKGLIISELDNISQVRYEIGFPLSSIDQIISDRSLGDVRFLKHHYHDRWFADPFILNADSNTISLLVEEYFYSSGKGRIARLTVDRSSFRLIGNEPVLELSTHLSFPFIRRLSGRILIYPESCRSGEWKEYEYNPDSRRIISEKTIVVRPFTDATFDHKGRILTTELPDPNSDSLSVYEFTDGSFSQTDKIVFDERIARNAGSVFQCGGRFFRPAQECNNSYGHSVVIQEVQDNDGRLFFTEHCRFPSPHPVLRDGCHTFNVYKDLVVIDVNGPRKPGMKSFFKFVYEHSFIRSR